MSKKAYSEQERETIKLKLMEEGLKLFSQRGIQKVRLMDIVQTVGISKPFFYTFYTSKEELVLNVLEYQWTLLFRILKQELSTPEYSWDIAASRLLHKILHSRENNLLILTQDEEVWVYSHLSPEDYILFQKGQEHAYREVMHILDIDTEKCSPQVFANLCLSIALVQNTAESSLPFFFTESLEQTAKAQIDMTVAYLKTMKCGK